VYNRKGYEMSNDTSDFPPSAVKGCTAYPFAQPRQRKGYEEVIGQDAGITDPAGSRVMPRPYASNGGGTEK